MRHKTLESIFKIKDSWRSKIDVQYERKQFLEYVMLKNQGSLTYSRTNVNAAAVLLFSYN